MFTEHLLYAKHSSVSGGSFFILLRNFSLIVDNVIYLHSTYLTEIMPTFLSSG